MKYRTPASFITLSGGMLILALASAAHASTIVEINFNTWADNADGNLDDGELIQDVSGNGYHGFWGATAGNIPVVSTPNGQGIDTSGSANGKVFPMSESDMEQKIGRDNLARMEANGWAFHQNDPQNPDVYTFVGVSSGGTPVWLHTEVASAELEPPDRFTGGHVDEQFCLVLNRPQQRAVGREPGPIQSRRYGHAARLQAESTLAGPAVVGSLDQLNSDTCRLESVGVEYLGVGDFERGRIEPNQEVLLSVAIPDLGDQCTPVG